MSVIDNVTPKQRWEFDENVANCFENMLERSIPDYHVMRYLITEIIIKCIQNKQFIHILDLGCSDGLMIKAMKEKLDTLKSHDFFYTGCDCSQPV